MATWIRRGHEVGGRAERAAAHDGARDPARVALFTVLGEHPRDLRFGPTVEKLAGCLAGRRIEPHIERLVRLEREAAPALVELIRGDAEIEEDRSDDTVGLSARHDGEVTEVCPAQPHAVTEGSQARSRAGQRLGIDVEPQQPDVVTGRSQHRFGVTAHPYRPVDHPAPASRSQEERDLVDERREVNC